jgi:hypothetical protein
MTGNPPGIGLGVPAGAPTSVPAGSMAMRFCATEKLW